MGVSYESRRGRGLGGGRSLAHSSTLRGELKDQGKRNGQFGRGARGEELRVGVDEKKGNGGCINGGQWKSELIKAVRVVR